MVLRQVTIWALVDAGFWTCSLASRRDKRKGMTLARSPCSTRAVPDNPLPEKRLCKASHATPTMSGRNFMADTSPATTSVPSRILPHTWESRKEGHNYCRCVDTNIKQISTRKFLYSCFLTYISAESTRYTISFCNKCNLGIVKENIKVAEMQFSKSWPSYLLSLYKEKQVIIQYCNILYENFWITMNAYLIICKLMCSKSSSSSHCQIFRGKMRHKPGNVTQLWQVLQ